MGGTPLDVHDTGSDAGLPQELPAATSESVIYYGPDQWANIHGNRIDISSQSRQGGTF